MSFYRYPRSIILGLSIAAVANAAENMQCVDIEIPAFNLVPDPECAISTNKLVERKLPDQDFVFPFSPPNVPTCFKLVDPDKLIWEEPDASQIPGTIHIPATGEEIEITVTGFAGLTLNHYPQIPMASTLSFTAATVVTIDRGNERIGKLVTRDAGAIYDYTINPEDLPDSFAAARLSIVAGTNELKDVVGFVDEVGKEFNLSEPAFAAGQLCGMKLADKLSDDDNFEEDDDFEEFDD